MSARKVLDDASASTLTPDFSERIVATDGRGLRNLVSARQGSQPFDAATLELGMRNEWHVTLATLPSFLSRRWV